MARWSWSRRETRVSNSCSPARGVEPLEARRLLTTLPSGFDEQQVVTDLHSPVSMSVAPDGRVFLTEQGGSLRVVRNGQLLATPFLTVTTPAKVERGLLGVELDPDFESNGFVYTYYTTSTPNVHNRVSRFTAVDADPSPGVYRPGDRAASGSETILYELDSAGDAAYHQGGSMHFGRDGKLYVAVGDHGGTVRAQQLTNQVGKILRLNKDGSIPTDNPFYNQASGKNRAIWALGLRNPFTFAIQPGTGRMFINDVGENTWEEVNEGKAGANYGWPESEGPTTDPRFTAPIYAYHHDGSDAIVGGTFYNPDNVQFPSSYVGKYFFMDFNKRHMKVLDPATRTVTLFGDRIIGRAVDVDVAPDGSLYYLTREVTGVTAAGLYRIRYTGSNAPSIGTQPKSVTVSAGKPATFTVAASGTSLSYQWQRKTAGASSFANISGATGSSYTLSAAALADSGTQFRVVAKNSAGSAASSAATLIVTSDRTPTATITSPASGATYAGGQSFTFSGTGTDPEDGSLPASAFTWQIDFHHADHTHPFMQPTSGVKSGTFTIPTTGEVSPDVFYRVYLKVKDSDGLTHTTFRDVKPREATMTIRSSVPGLRLTLDGAPFTSPQSVLGVTGIRRAIGAPAAQTLNGTTYEFVSWSDGGAATHTISTPAANTTYTATYRVAGTGGGTKTLSAVADGYVRDGTGAARNYGGDKQLLVKTSPYADSSRTSFLKFDLSTLGTVGSAKLRLFGRLEDTSATSVTTGIFAATDTDWSEGGLTWSNRPATGTSPLATARVSSDAARWYEWDLTDYLRQQKAAGKRFVTLVVRNTGVTRAAAAFNSDEAAASGPQLVVTT
jgi:glucose/arabinose dehydrogenase